MKGRWFRFYESALTDPKVAMLSDWEFRIWVKVLIVASQNDGKIPPLEIASRLLNSRLDRLSRALNKLVKVGLMDLKQGRYEPHNWSQFQYKSDTSAERMRKHRAKSDVTNSPPRTEAETETDKKGANAPKKARDDSPVTEAFKAFCETAQKIGLPVPQKLTARRKGSIQARLQDAGGIDGWHIALDKLAASSFCRGEQGNFQADLDFFIQEKSFNKLMEGSYDDRPNSGRHSRRDQHPMAAALEKLGKRVGLDGDPFETVATGSERGRVVELERIGRSDSEPRQHADPGTGDVDGRTPHGLFPGQGFRQHGDLRRVIGGAAGALSGGGWVDGD